MPVPKGDLAAKLAAGSAVRESGCIEWTGWHYQNGYGGIPWGYKKPLAHRVAWALANGPIPDGMVVMHLCDNRLCVNVAHLRAATQRENMEDAKRKGRMRASRGEASPKAKLTSDDVTAIRAARASGESVLSISKRYPVSGKQISVVSRGVQWGHMKETVWTKSS